MDVPTELLADIDAFTARWDDPKLCAWLETLPEQLAQSMSEKRFGDLKRWREALSSLPDIAPEQSVSTLIRSAHQATYRSTRVKSWRARFVVYIPGARDPSHYLVSTSIPNGGQTSNGPASQMP
jgi:hypothetical protein